MEQLVYAYLGRNIVDQNPEFSGDKKHEDQLGDAMIGAMKAEINRSDPPITIERLAIRGGESIAFIGPNGVGKSTVLDACTEQRNARFTAGSHGYREGVHGIPTLRIGRLNQEELFDGVGALQAQDIIYIAIEKYKLDHPIDWENDEMYDQNLRYQAAWQRSEALIGRMGDLFEVKEFLHRKVDELSGGERTKLALAILLASEPDVLFLDEPTNHMDLEGIAKLTGLLQNYKNAGVAVVSISHVEWFLDMAGMDGMLELKYDGSGARVLTQSKSQYRDFKKKEKDPAPFARPVHWSEAYGYPRKGGAVCTTAERSTIPNSPLVSVEIPTLHAGEITILSGKNGTGKTKLMEELVDKRSKILQKERGMQIAYMPQFWPPEVAKGTVEGFFDWVKASTNHLSNVASSRFLKELRDIGFGKNGKRDILSTPLAAFSGGEQRLMWFVAASVVEGTDVLVLDEPTNHMDRNAMLAVADAIKKFPGGVILSTHDLRLMQEIGGNTAESKHGVNNIVFEKDKTTGNTRITVSKQSPADYANQVIDASRRSAKAVQL